MQKKPKQNKKSFGAVLSVMCSGILISSNKIIH